MICKLHRICGKLNVHIAGSPVRSKGLRCLCQNSARVFVYKLGVKRILLAGNEVGIGNAVNDRYSVVLRYILVPISLIRCTGSDIGFRIVHCAKIQRNAVAGNNSRRAHELLAFIRGTGKLFNVVSVIRQRAQCVVYSHLIAVSIEAEPNTIVCVQLGIINGSVGVQSFVVLIHICAVRYITGSSRKISVFICYGNMTFARSA